MRTVIALLIGITIGLTSVGSAGAGGGVARSGASAASGGAKPQPRQVVIRRVDVRGGVRTETRTTVTTHR